MEPNLKENDIVNGKKIDDHFASDKVKGSAEINFPHVVAKKSFFVLGDNRSVSVDSRSYAIGDINSDQIVGKIVLRI